MINVASVSSNSYFEDVACEASLANRGRSTLSTLQASVTKKVTLVNANIVCQTDNWFFYYYQTA